MSIMLCSLVLNEMEWLPRLWEQHRNWQGICGWAFVESADRAYAETSPWLVKNGLSVDGTSDFLSELAATDPSVVYIPFGTSQHTDPAQGKCESRTQYLKVANILLPKYVIVIDADEFYTHNDQQRITDYIHLAEQRWYGFIFKQRHIWRPQAIANQPLFAKEVIRGYWSVPHCRVWRFEHGMEYISDHNRPRLVNGTNLVKRMQKVYGKPKQPECVHMGFASSQKFRQAKHRYYEFRGEGESDGRQMYVDCRRAFEQWQIGSRLPHRATVINYYGPIPEVFQEQKCQHTNTTFMK